MSPAEWLSAANLVLNMVILPIAVFVWRMSQAVVRMEQILISHAERLERAERTLDAAREGTNIDRRKPR